MGLLLGLVRGLGVPRVDPRRLFGALAVVTVAALCVPVGVLLLVAGMSVAFADLIGVAGGLAVSGLLVLIAAAGLAALAGRLARGRRRPAPLAGPRAGPPRSASPATLVAAAVVGVAAGLSPRLRRYLARHGI